MDRPGSRGGSPICPASYLSWARKKWPGGVNAREPLVWGDPRRINGLPGGSLDGFGTRRSNTRPPGGRVAQLVEQRIENPRVGGSIPPPATIQIVSYTGHMGDGLYRRHG